MASDVRTPPPVVCLAGCGLVHTYDPRASWSSPRRPSGGRARRWLARRGPVGRPGNACPRVEGRIVVVLPAPGAGRTTTRTEACGRVGPAVAGPGRPGRA